MPRPGLRWWHVMFSTLGAWLPGERRGFRSRDHRIHSSGDYKNPPPEDEHAGLRRYHKDRHPKPIVIPRESRLIIATVIATVLKEHGYIVLVVSVSAKHVHIVAELPVDEREFNKIIGKCKNKSSRAVRKQMPGRIWARDDSHKMIRNKPHRRNVFKYVAEEQGPTAATWCCEGWTREAEIQ